VAELHQSVFTTTIVKEGRVFAENEFAFAFPTNMPITPGHSLIAPKRVVASLEEINSDERLAILELAVVVQNALRKAVAAKGFNCAWNEGSDFGQSVSHFHLHVVPRVLGDTGITQYEPREFLYRPGSRSVTSTEELVDIAQLIKSEIPEEFQPSENH